MSYENSGGNCVVIERLYVKYIVGKYIVKMRD